MANSFRTRKLTSLDALPNTFDGKNIVFEFGIVRIQPSSPLESLIGKSKIKFVFSDHSADFDNTWVFLPAETAIDVLATAIEIARAEQYGRFIGTYSINHDGTPTFIPREDLLPSEASSILRSGIEKVMAKKSNHFKN